MWTKQNECEWGKSHKIDETIVYKLFISHSSGRYNSTELCMRRSFSALVATASRGVTATWCVGRTQSGRLPPAAPTPIWRSAVWLTWPLASSPSLPTARSCPQHIRYNSRVWRRELIHDVAHKLQYVHVVISFACGECTAPRHSGP